MAERFSIGWLVFVSFLGALGGVVFGKVCVLLVPALKTVFHQGVDLSIDLEIIRFGMRFNVAAVFGVAVALFILWRRR